jgi:hypothetical protein
MDFEFHPFFDLSPISLLIFLWPVPLLPSEILPWAEDNITFLLYNQTRHLFLAPFLLLPAKVSIGMTGNLAGWLDRVKPFFTP